MITRFNTELDAPIPMLMHCRDDIVSLSTCTTDEQSKDIMVHSVVQCCHRKKVLKVNLVVHTSRITLLHGDSYLLIVVVFLFAVSLFGM